MNTRTFPRSVIAGMIAAALIASGCDPRRALGPNDRPQAEDEWVLAGRITNVHGTPLAGVSVDVPGIGAGVSDPAGMYHITRQHEDLQRSDLLIRLDAAGYAPISRKVHLTGRWSDIPTIQLTPLAHTVLIVPEGGSHAYSNGVVLLAEAGSVDKSTPVGVTVLGQQTLGKVGDGEAAVADLAFYLNTNSTAFGKPLRISIPLVRQVDPLSNFTLYTFSIERLRWAPVGHAIIAPTGTVVDVEIAREGLYALQEDEPNWASRNTAPDAVSVTTHGSSTLVGTCMGPGTIMSGDYPYTPYYWLSVADQFPGLDAHLWELYGSPRTAPSRALLTIEQGQATVYKLGVFEVRTRYGEVWLKANPAVKTPYEYVSTKFLRWESSWEPCGDPQGVIVS